MHTDEAEGKARMGGSGRTWDQGIGIPRDR
jgi:hypothetical protein